MDARIFAGAAALLLILGGCTSGANTVDDSRAPERQGTTQVDILTQQIRVTRNTQRGPEVCRPRQLGETISKHFDAINKGDTGTAMDYVSPERGWYSVTDATATDRRRHFVTGSSDELREYFDRRIAQNERIYLLEMDVDYERARDVAHVAYNLLRTADDLTDDAELAVGKGAIKCDTGRIAVWSVGQDPTVQEVGDFCPGKPRPPQIALACARGGSHR